MCTLSQLSRRTSRSVRLIQQRRYSSSCLALRTEAIAQDPFVALVFSIVVNTIVLHSSSQFRQAFTFCTNTHFQLNLSCFPCLDSQIACLPIATIRLVSPWRHPWYLFVVLHTSTVWFASTSWWNWRRLHLYLRCSGQHWCGESARASSRNRCCRHSTDFPEP